MGSLQPKKCYNEDEFLNNIIVASTVQLSINFARLVVNSLLSAPFKIDLHIFSNRPFYSCLISDLANLRSGVPIFFFAAGRNA